jgi:glycosyltransferase involved in cell wall biosynthesis
MSAGRGASELERSGPAPVRRVAAVGLSLEGPCGVRDYARGLAEALPAQGVECSLHWASRSERGLAAVRAQLRDWRGRLGAELAEQRPDAVLLHYSVFPFSYRGLPLFVAPTLATLGRLGVPVVSILHEPAYPWHLSGARGKVWAASHRIALAGVVRASSALAVTVEQRALWIASRRWLPERALAVSPVFSNLPAPAPGATANAGRIGLFGYVHEGIVMDTVLDAISLLDAQGAGAELALLGAPGADSDGGRRWTQAATARGSSPPAFRGPLPAQALSDELARCELLLSAESIGPSSRRTTLAASLAAGRPVVALDGRQTWRELREQEAVRLVEPQAAALAIALGELLADADARSTLGARGAAFARERMSSERSARMVAELLAGAAGSAQPPRADSHADRAAA